MPKKPRTFQRPLGERRYKKLFVVSVEGSKTEPQYFAIFNQPQSIVLVEEDRIMCQLINHFELHQAGHSDGITHIVHKSKKCPYKRDDRLV